MLDADAARELAADPGACIGCRGRIEQHRHSSLWCEACWAEAMRTGEVPDLLAGGQALRGNMNNGSPVVVAAPVDPAREVFARLARLLGEPAPPRRRPVALRAQIEARAAARAAGAAIFDRLQGRTAAVELVDVEPVDAEPVPLVDGEQFDAEPVDGRIGPYGLRPVAAFGEALPEAV